MSKRKPRCPVCKEILSPNPAYERLQDPKFPWLECTTDDCALVGLEGFSWHWEYLNEKLCTGGKP